MPRLNWQLAKNWQTLSFKLCVCVCQQKKKKGKKTAKEKLTKKKKKTVHIPANLM